MEIKYAKDTSKTNEDIEPKFGVWYPIESAPKDGSDILLSTGKYITVGSWLDDLSNIDQPGWTNYSVDDWVDRSYSEINATHWMPLPPNP